MMIHRYFSSKFYENHMLQENRKRERKNAIAYHVSYGITKGLCKYLFSSGFTRSQAEKNLVYPNSFISLQHPNSELNLYNHTYIPEIVEGIAWPMKIPFLLELIFASRSER